MLAAGIIELVDNEMAKILRIVSIERGYDPRTFTMMAFGGGGPLHACALADALEVTRVVVPPSPGLFSAWGLLVADVRASYVRTIVARTDQVDSARVDAAFAEMERTGRDELAAQGIEPKAIVLIRELDIRYLGQGYELAVPMTNLAHAIDAFHEKHERTYGYASREDTVEVVAARLVAVGEVAKPNLSCHGERSDAKHRVVEPPRPSSHRRVYFAKNGWTNTPIYQREQLEAGTSIKAPAIIEQYDSATLVAPSWTAAVDELSNLNLVRA